jgi:hypothetical protein
MLKRLPLPSATPPQDLAAFSVVTGVNHRVTAFGYRGGSLFERRDLSMAGALVKHPKGDLLIDTGEYRSPFERIAISHFGIALRSPVEIERRCTAGAVLRSREYVKQYRALLLRLKHARKEAGLTQVQAARQLSKPQSFISKLKSGEGLKDNDMRDDDNGIFTYSLMRSSISESAEEQSGNE